MFENAKDAFITLFFAEFMALGALLLSLPKPSQINSKQDWKEAKPMWLWCIFFLVCMIISALGYIYAPEGATLYEFYDSIFR